MAYVATDADDRQGTILMALESTIACSRYPTSESEIRRLADSREQRVSSRPSEVAQPPNVPPKVNDGIP